MDEGTRLEPNPDSGSRHFEVAGRYEQVSHRLSRRWAEAQALARARLARHLNNREPPEDGGGGRFGRPQE